MGGFTSTKACVQHEVIHSGGNLWKSWTATCNVTWYWYPQALPRFTLWFKAWSGLRCGSGLGTNSVGVLA